MNNLLVRLSLVLGVLCFGVSDRSLAGGCGYSVQQTWLKTYTARADTTDDCSGTEITLRVRNAAGRIVLEKLFQSGQLFGFEDARSPGGMRIALEEWISRYPAQATADQLPRWRSGEDTPDHLEFPFYIDDAMTRERYEQIRQEKRPLQCIVQGMESLLCLTPDDSGGAVVVLGFQSFPG